MKVVGPCGRTWDFSTQLAVGTVLVVESPVHSTRLQCVPGPGDTGERAMERKDPASGEEEGFHLSSYTLKTLVPPCDTDCNPSKWRGLVTGLTFRKQSMLWCLLWNVHP